jgi:hypothetical protein
MEHKVPELDFDIETEIELLDMSIDRLTKRVVVCEVSLAVMVFAFVVTIVALI